LAGRSSCISSRLLSIDIYLDQNAAIAGRADEVEKLDGVEKEKEEKDEFGGREKPVDSPHQSSLIVKRNGR
jgi:hypothetical protein